MVRTAHTNIPAFFSREIKVDGNRARHLVLPRQEAMITRDERDMVAEFADGTRYPIVRTRRGLESNALVLKAPATVFADVDRIPAEDDLSWSGEATPAAPDGVLASLGGAFRFLEASADGSEPGLRKPQLGAVHAVLGYWTTGAGDPATVVMPTGTGKTETMVALFAVARPERLLIVVPSDALRTQIGGKLEGLGVLQSSGVIAGEALRPVVGQIDHRFSGAEAARRFATACNVLVTTPNALFPAKSPEISQALLDACSHLFVDEAHHVEARTWRQIRDAFEGKPVLQFTATPFREDGRRLAGRQVYRFPLRLAQEQGYFAPIEYRSVIDLVDQDRALAELAVQRLRADTAKNKDHVLMARVATIRRAEELQELYAEVAADLGPIFLHSRMAARDRRAALEALRTRSSRIIVCVDMLGEGFDLPALKVAAIHDPHKSLGVTLQFVGRFARVADDDIGSAAVFVGRPDLDYDHNLRRLFAEDADWNRLISDLSEDAVGEQEAIGDFEAGFGSEPDEVSIRSLAPKMSTVVYRTNCEDWNADGVLGVHPEETLLTVPLPVNPEAKVAWFVVKLETPVEWGELPAVEEITYDLYVVYWDEARQLLYINSSNKGSHHERLAGAVAGSDAQRIEGAEVYRAMHGIQRLIPTNVGVLDILDRDRRFSLYAGANVSEGFPTGEGGTKTQTNIFGSGFEEGERVTIGASLKGRVWSFAPAPTLKHWIDWCDHVGPKLADESITPEAVIASFILPERLEELPEMVALGIEWPIELALNTSDATVVELGGSAWPVADAELGITEFEAGAPIPFEVRAPDWSAGYVATIEDERMSYRAIGGEVILRRGRSDPIPLSAYFASKSSGPLILLEQDAAILHPGLLLKPDLDLDPFPRESLDVLDWSGVSLRKESQGRERDPSSIQARAIEHVKALADWKVLLDDDGTGEVADIVAIRIVGDELHVLLVHCKYSHGDDPGARIHDLYDVCGQAQKSTKARAYPGPMFAKLIRRERDRVKKYGHSGFEVGDIQELYRLHDESRLLRTAFTIAIAQPGVSREGATDAQLRLLAGTELYVREVAKAGLSVLCSA